jgi:HEAT repeat protein
MVAGAAGVGLAGRVCIRRLAMQRTSRFEIDDLLELTRDEDAAARAKALQSLCPCHVKRNEGRVWDRVLSLVDDPSPKVRSHVFHLLADGSPRERESEVVAAIERLCADPDEKLRRRARKLMAQYRRGGRINAL